MAVAIERERSNWENHVGNPFVMGNITEKGGFGVLGGGKRNGLFPLPFPIPEQEDLLCPTVKQALLCVVHVYHLKGNTMPFYFCIVWMHREKKLFVFHTKTVL